MKLKKYILALLVFVFAATACDLVDPSDVNNPAITHEKLLDNATTGTIPLITGLEYEFAVAVRKTALYTENVSDNYRNEYTFLSNVFDDPSQITPNETVLNDRREIYGTLTRGMALANFGFEVVIANDKEVTDKQIAEAHFYKGMFLLLLSENFAAFPLEEGGKLEKAEDVLPKAIEEFNKSNELDNSNSVRNSLAIARAYRLLGNEVEAKTAAQQAVGGAFVFNANYDKINLENHIYRYATAHQDDMQPLPRLDFLDPKFTEKDTPISVLKTEEAYLILAEIALVNNDDAAAKSNMIDAITLAKTRETVIYVDKDERKSFGDTTRVIFSSTSQDTIDGLCVNRETDTEDDDVIETITHPISNTHLTADDVNNSTNLYYTLYLLRQEIFFSEGRRMSDLGIRLPVNQRQIETNSAVSDGEYGTRVIVPEFIPTGKGLDDYDYENDVVTIHNDMNRIISNENNIKLVSPFLK